MEYLEVYFKFYTFIQFAWQGFGSRGAAGLVSVRRHMMLSPCQRQFQATNMDLLLAKTESTTDAGVTCGLTY